MLRTVVLLLLITRFTVGGPFVRPCFSSLSRYEGIRRPYPRGTVTLLFTRFTGRRWI